MRPRVIFNKAEERRKNLVDDVHELMRVSGINVPFFIGGGSVFSAYTGTSFNDIDIFFYRQNDYDTFKDAVIQLKQKELERGKEKVKWIQDIRDVETSNAFSFDYGDKKYQLIQRNFGDPRDVMRKFDINCSKCTITSEYVYITDDSWSDVIELDFSKLYTDTLARVHKYVTSKGAKDKNGVLQTLITYFIEHKDDMFTECYEGAAKKAGHDIIRTYVYSIDDQMSQLIHDEIIRIYPNKKERFKIFDQQVYNILRKDIEFCDEAVCADLLKSYAEDRRDFSVNPLTPREIKARYVFPEKFI